MKEYLATVTLDTYNPCDIAKLMRIASERNKPVPPPSAFNLYGDIKVETRIKWDHNEVEAYHVMAAYKILHNREDFNPTGKDIMLEPGQRVAVVAGVIVNGQGGQIVGVSPIRYVAIPDLDHTDPWDDGWSPIALKDRLYVGDQYGNTEYEFLLHPEDGDVNEQLLRKLELHIDQSRNEVNAHNAGIEQFGCNSIMHLIHPRDLEKMRPEYGI